MVWFWDPDNPDQTIVRLPQFEPLERLLTLKYGENEFLHRCELLIKSLNDGEGLWGGLRQLQAEGVLSPEDMLCLNSNWFGGNAAQAYFPDMPLGKLGEVFYLGGLEAIKAARDAVLPLTHQLHIRRDVPGDFANYKYDVTPNTVLVTIMLPMPKVPGGTST